MKNLKITLLIITIFSSIFFPGCWNYREIDKLSIVTGVAIDRTTDNQYKITVELAQTSGGKEAKTKSKLVTMEGKTFFDAVRNGISVSGEKLYWGHSKVIIASKEVANEGVSKILDWYTRDSETREDVYILISEESTAKEILETGSGSEEILSMMLGEVINNENNLSKAAKTDIIKYEIENMHKDTSSIIPTVYLFKLNGKITPRISGAAIIKDDKLAGILDGEETKDLLFIRDEIKGGVLVEEFRTTPVTLEIFKNKTKLKPQVDGMNIKMEVNVETTVALDEVQGYENFIDEDGIKELEQRTKDTLKSRMEVLIKKVQEEYDADIFGFGIRILENYPKVWKNVGGNWEEIFKDIKVNVNTKVHIKNSGVTSKTIIREEE